MRLRSSNGDNRSPPRRVWCSSTPSTSSASTPTGAHDHRRGPHPGLVPLLASLYGRERQRRGDEPENLDKEYVRLAYVRDNYDARSPSRGRCNSWRWKLRVSARRPTPPSPASVRACRISRRAVRRRCSPTTAEPTIFRFYRPRERRRRANIRLETGFQEGTGSVQDGARVGVIMGSDSDWETMSRAADILEHFGVPFEAKVVSAHRTDWMVEYAETAEQRIEIIIAGAGGAAHLPGMVAGHTIVPVVGVPIKSRALNGMDSRCRSCRCPAAFPSPPWRSGRWRHQRRTLCRGDVGPSRRCGSNAHAPGGAGRPGPVDRTRALRP